MHPQQQHARFDLIVISVALFLAFDAFWILYLTLGPGGATAGFAFLAITGVMGFDSRFYRKKDGDAVLMDERDLVIQRRARSIGWNVVWLYWCIACMGPWFFMMVKHGASQVDTVGIPIHFLPISYMLAMIVHVAASSVAVLVMYRGGVSEHEA